MALSKAQTKDLERILFDLLEHHTVDSPKIPLYQIKRSLTHFIQVNGYKKAEK